MDALKIEHRIMMRHTYTKCGDWLVFKHGSEFGGKEL